MEEVLSFGLFVFTSFLAIINPFGIAPVFIALTEDLSPKLKFRTALKATVTAFIVLIIFGFAGQLLFKFFGISANGFRIAGGAIFFAMGYEMLNARLSKIKYNPDEENIAKNEADNIAITPIGIPMLAGPGAITNAIVLMQDAQSYQSKIVFPIGILAALFFAFLILVGGSKFMKYIGPTGNKVMLKIMGLITMVIAIEFFVAGIKPILRDIFMISG